MDGPRAALRHPGELAQLDRPALLLEPVEGRLLLRRDGRQRVGELVPRDRLDEHRLPRPGVLADARRHHRVEHLAPPAQVVVGHPPRQLHQVVVDERVVVEDAGDGLDLARRRPVGDADAEARGAAVALAERGLDPLADADLLGEVRRDGVGVGVVERAVEDDVGEERGRRAGGVNPRVDDRLAGVEQGVGGRHGRALRGR